MTLKKGDNVEILSMDKILEGTYKVGDVQTVVGFFKDEIMVSDPYDKNDYWFFKKNELRKVEDVQTNK